MSRPQRFILLEGAAAGTLRNTAVSHIAFRVPDVAIAAKVWA